MRWSKLCLLMEPVNALCRPFWEAHQFIRLGNSILRCLTLLFRDSSLVCQQLIWFSSERTGVSTALISSCDVKHPRHIQTRANCSLVRVTSASYMEVSVNSQSVQQAQQILTDLPYLPGHPKQVSEVLMLASNMYMLSSRKLLLSFLGFICVVESFMSSFPSETTRMESTTISAIMLSTFSQTTAAPYQRREAELSGDGTCGYTSGDGGLCPSSKDEQVVDIS